MKKNKKKQKRIRALHRFFFQIITERIVPNTLPTRSKVIRLRIRALDRFFPSKLLPKILYRIRNRPGLRSYDYGYELLIVFFPKLLPKILYQIRNRPGLRSYDYGQNNKYAWQTKQQGHKISEQFDNAIHGKKNVLMVSAQMLGGVSITSRNGSASRKGMRGQWSNYLRQ